MKSPRCARLCAWSVSLLSLAAVPHAWAHRLEPIVTEFALPLQPGQTNVEMTYEYERDRDGTRSAHTVPDFELERGLTRRVQFHAGLPLVRSKEEKLPANLSGGHLELGIRFLLAGGGSRHWALSVNPSAALPTGNRRLFGNSTEVGAALHFDRFFARNVRWHTNLGLASAVGGEEAGHKVIRASSALVIPLARRWYFAPEIIGVHRPFERFTELAAQPGMIFYVNRHLELKVGLPAGLTEATPRLGVRSQIALIWGGSD